MTILRDDDRCETVLARPGLYRIDADPVQLQFDRQAAPALAELLVSALGDFLIHRQRSHRGVTIDGRPPLGGIERLADHATIVVPRGADREPLRWLYLRSGPPIEFALPDGAAVRCAYSYRELAAAVAVRCPGCATLYHKTSAWETELSRRCPVCGWSEDEGEDRC